MSKFRFTAISMIKSISCASILALSLLSLPASHLAAVRAAGPSAEGSFEFSGEDRLTKSIEFSAAADGSGGATGRMTFNGPAEIPDQNVDGADEKGFSGSLANLYIEANLDGMLVEKNRAVMSGTITESNLGDYIGQRVLLVVEDNGDGSDEKSLDKFTIGIYKPVTAGWTPTDAELKDDNGALLTWIATDAEREDDRGVPSKKSTEITCQSFPLSSFSLDDVRSGDGSIKVQE
ncbi:MAG: hypothetical protein H7Z38_10420 [Rubrivivax sp.]|nr:hypothetical protein [Pyrinomonadaceae bacterium]